MKQPMTKQAGRQFVKRWKAINAFERQELRNAPPAEKFRQLEALMQSAPGGGASGKAIVPDVPELALLRQALSDLLRWLAETNVPGIIIGGVAASLLGHPRLTRDVDAPENLVDLNDIFRRVAAPRSVKKLGTAKRRLNRTS